MKQWFLHKKLGVTLSGLFITAIPIIGLTLFVYFQSANYIEEIVITENQQSALVIADRIKEQIDGDVRLGNLLVIRRSLKTAIQSTDRKEIARHLKDYIEHSVTIEHAFITNTRGNLLANYPNSSSLINRDFSQRDWYKGISQNWQPYVSEFYLRTSTPQRYVFSISIPIRDDDDRVIGILGLQPEDNYVKNAVSYIHSPHNQTAYVVDNNGNLIYHPKFTADRIIDLSGSPAVQRVKKGQTGVEIVSSPDGQRMLTAYHPVEGNGWGVVVERPEKEAYAPLREITFGLFAFASLMLLTAVYFAYKRSELIYSLQKLTEELETRVMERTAELNDTNIQLTLEIDERKQAQEKIERLRIEKELLLTSAGEGIFGLDLDGNHTFVNPVAAEMLGYPIEELLHKHSHTICHHTRADGSPYPEDECPIYKAFKDATVHHVRDEVFWRKDHSSFPVAYTSTPIKEDSKLVGAVVTFRDITERKRAEENLARAMADLARSNAELEQLAYIASHDLQEPLRMVASFVQLLGKRYKGKLDGDADDFINYAVDGANRMQILINDLLAYSRVGRRGKEFKEVSCEIVLDQAMSNLQNLIEQSGAVVTRNPLPVAKGDDIQLMQLFQNLIGNAIKFSRDRAPHIQVAAERRVDDWCFYVRDNGIGIESEYFERIFSIFQRLHDRRQYPGTGIGLAICKKVVEHHGGRIWVESEPGTGSTFYFTLPAQKELIS
jgi:PAS domain S-box-containing protein